MTLKDKDAITLGNVTATAGAADVEAVTGKATVNGAVTATDEAKVKATAGAVEVASAGSVAGDAKTTLDGNAGVTGSGAVGKAGSQVDVDAANGQINLTGVVLGADADFTAKDAVSVANVNNDFTGTVTAQGASVTLKDKDAITLGNVTATENGVAVEAESITASGTVTANGDGTYANVLLKATGTGGVTLNGDVTAAKNVSVIATTGKIQQEANVTANGGTVDVDAAGTLNMTAGKTTTATGNILYVGNGGTVNGTLNATDPGAKAKVVGVGIGGGADLTADEIELNVTHLGTADSPVTLNASKMAIEASSGGIYVNNTKATEIVSVDGTAADAFKVNRVKFDLTTEEHGLAAGAGTANGLSAQNGDIVLNNTGTITVNADVTAKNVTLTATGDGSFTAQNGATVEATAGNVEVYASGDVKINSAATVKAGKDVTIETTSGNITVGKDGSTAADKADASSITAGENVSLTADTAAGQGVTIRDAASVNATVGAVEVTAKGGINVNDTATVEAGTSVAVKSTSEGDITIDTTGKGAGDANKGVTANNGNVTIDNANGAVTIQNATVEAKGDAGDVAIAATTGVTISKDSQNATVKAAKDVTVDNSTSGNIVIGTAGATGDGTSVSAAAGKVAVNNAAADVSVLGGAKVTAKTDVDIDAKGSVLMDDSAAVKAETGALTADAADGSVTVADKADVDAGTTLGLTAGTEVKVTEDAQVDAGDAVALTAKGGDVTVDGSADVTAGKGATLTASKGVDVLGDATVTANGGDAVLTAQGEDVKVTGDVKASANATVGANTAVVVSEDGTVKATSGDVAVTAKNAVTVTDTAAVEAGAAVTMKSTDAGDVTINTTKNVTANNGSVTIDNADGAVTIQNATVTAGQHVLVETSGGDITVKEATVAAGDNLRLGSAGNVKVDTGVTMTAAGNATIEAKGDVTLNSGVNATGEKKTMEILAGNTVAMGDGVTVSTQNGNIAVVADKGNIDIASLDAGEGNVWLEAGGTIRTKNGDGETGISAAGAAMSSSKIGTEEDPLKLNLETMALSGTDGVYVENGRSTTIVSASQNPDNGSFNVNHVEKTGSVTSTTPGTASQNKGDAAEIGGVVSEKGDVVLTNNGRLEITSGAQVGAAAGNVEMKVAGDVVIDSGAQIAASENVDIISDGSIWQIGPSIVADRRGVVNNDVGGVAGVLGKTVTLKATANIGQGVGQESTPVRVEGAITATAGGTVSVGASSGDLTVNSVSGTDVNVYAPGSIGSGEITARGTLTVTAGDYGNSEVVINAKKLVVNRIEGGHRPQLAMFKTKGSNDPDVKNQPNDTIIFVDGRVAGGDIQTINKLGAMEAFPVQTPELKSEQGVFGNPIFLHDELDVANPLAVGAIDFLLQEPARLSYGSEFPREADEQIAISGLNPTTSYWFGKKHSTKEDGGGETTEPKKEPPTKK